MHSPPEMSAWAGRVDVDPAGDTRRVHQVVQPFSEASKPGFVVFGFCSDEGVRRNGGREGAAQGPRAIRKVLGNMAWHAGDTHLADWGDLQIGSEGLEGLQAELQSATQALVAAGHIPLVLGGGHEVAFGTGSGVLLSGRKTATLGIINIDAHLDLRVASERNSGTSFSALMDLSAAERRTVSYLCIGTALSSNTPALFSRAKSLGAEWLMDEEVLASAQAAESVVNELLSASDDLYLSIDMDVFPAHEAPGVSAPAALGVPAAVLLPVIKTIVRSGRLRAVDVAELNPTFDLDNRTARLAARIIHAIIHERLT